MSERLKVLLIDDDEEDFLIISDMFAEISWPEYTLDWVRAYQDGLDTICRGEHVVCLLDYFLGSRNGLDLLKEAIARGCKAPIILLTGFGNYEIDVQAMKSGAVDYLAKGEFSVHLLERTIRYAIERKQTEDELQRHRQELEKLVVERTLQHAEARAEAERRAIDAEMRQAVLQALLEHIPEGIAIVDSSDLKVKALSRYALELVGLPRKEFDDRYLSAQQWSPSQPILERFGPSGGLPIARAALDGKIVANEEWILKTPDNKKIPVLVSAGPIRDSSGNITGAVAAWRDMSELKRIQKELQQARDDLEIRVYQRTLELAETMQSLRESQTQLKSLAARLLHAQEDERKRIARELHDSIGSSLSAVKFGLENAAQQMQKGESVADIFSQLSAVISYAIDESRRIMTDLRPSILDDLGIIVTVDWFCRRYQSLYDGIRIDKTIRIEEAEIPEHLKITIFRIIQEAMNNTAKHGRAGKITLSLARNGNCIELCIEDDGVGFDLDSIVSKVDFSKFGLTSMRERAELSRGRFDMESKPGAGTKIRTCWDLC
jgi:PAS domain S-box-containing protein